MTPAQQQAAAEARARADRTRADILSAATKYDTISMPSATVFTDNRGRNVLLRGEEAENYTEAVDLRSDLRFAMPDEEMPDTLIYCHPTTMPDAMAISATWRQDALSDPSITKIPLIGAYWDSEVGQYYTLVRDVYTGQFEKMWIDSETCEEIDTDPIGHFFDVMTPGCRDLGNEQSLGNFGWCGLDLIGMIPGLSFTKVGRVAKVAKVVDEIGDAAKATKIGEIVRIGERYLVKASEETLNTFRKPFDKFIGANRIKFSENRIIHFTEELKQGAQFIDTGMPNTRLNQIKKLFEIKTDSEVRDLIEKAIKTKPEPDIYNPGRVIYRTIDSKQRILKVIVDESDGTIITVIGEH
jgi:hypothetical protein